MEQESAASIEARCGHPETRWAALQARVQDERVQAFSEIEADWIGLMWCLDCYREASVLPSGVGSGRGTLNAQLGAYYRGKGNWFATLIALLLENQTSHRLAPRVRVQGFSQLHQIDVAWPDREVDPLVCLETKVTGAPATSSVGARGAMADWTNRRKELKFAATDLKLFRRQHLTSIDHWDVWRRSVFPKTYFLWAARLTPRDRIERMVQESQALVQTYLEGAGIAAWRGQEDGTYRPISLPPADRVSHVDDVLFKIASEIRQIAAPGQAPPAPVTPAQLALNPQSLLDDDQHD